MHSTKFLSLLRYFLAVICFALLSQFKTAAQEINHYYSHLDEEKWFPRQSVRCIFQDKKGYLWIGTNAGLFRYDTHELTNFDMSNYTQTKFLNNSINSITEDQNGNIIVATESGVGIINPLSSYRKVVTTSDEFVSEVLVSKAGEIWFYNSKQEIYKVNSKKSSHKLSPYLSLLKTSGFQNVKINQLYFNTNGELFIATNKGLFKIDQQNKKLIYTGINNNVQKVFGSDLGKMFVVLDNGLYQLNHLKGNNSYLVENSGLNINGLKQLVGDPQKIIITATSNKIFAIADQQDKPTAVSLVQDFIKLSNIYIKVLFVDKSLNIWIGTQKGLYKIKRQKIGVSFYSDFAGDAKDGNTINDLFYDHKDRIWILNSAEGVYKLELKSNKISKFPIPYKEFNSIKRAYDGSLMLVGSGKMFEIFDANSDAYLEYSDRHLPNDVTDMAEIAQGEWWITSWRQGLVRFCKPKSEITKENFLMRLSV
ncbi:sensor histidine kinase/response regulator [Arcticibacter svalbardensis MN12-7]|uniref:Sensor histidine kinase/response regulator n=1 Tax=Arcticibacter svalbardensis MN12-7 TaxID=1150600 RepID=R9GLY0_9SPHI|nr:two-component regulator propeller domain-containing protein [Arcticibacter svalbardensis]EOR92550.1 sensor histidine kinase/response regulator [Arcticibacter svalbardensis MN12-7]